MREVDVGKLQLLFVDVLPDVELGPVREREDPEVLTRSMPGVVQVPQFRSLRTGVPLAELVAKREDPFFGPRLLLVSAAAPEDRVIAVLFKHPEQSEGLEPVACGAGHRLLDDRPAVDVLLHRADHEPDLELAHLLIAVLDDLGEIVPRVHMHDRERHALGPAGLGGQMEQDSGVLASREQERGPLEFSDHLTNDVNRLGRERVKVGETVSH